MCLVIFCFTSRSLEFLGRGVYEAMLILEVKGQTGGGGEGGIDYFIFFPVLASPLYSVLLSGCLIENFLYRFNS